MSEPQQPDSGTGVPPVFSEKITRRHLPHWQLAGATYFITWRCATGITLTEAERDIVLSALKHWDGIRWDLYAAVVMPDHVHVLACPLEKGKGRWDLGELLHSVKSFSAHQIAKARRDRRDAGPNPLAPSLVGPAVRPAVGPAPVGPASRRSSSIWQDERYDRWIRDDDELAEKWAYIVGNAVKAGLVEQPDQYRWLYLRAFSIDRRDAGPTPLPVQGEATE